jgi:hypothetical protein
MSKKAVAFRPQSGLSFIEQLQIVANEKCSKDNRPYLTGVNVEHEKLIHIRANCKMWDCPSCSATNAKLWIAKIINGINKLGGEWSFLTLTAHRKQRKLKSVSNIRDGWKKFYNRILSNFEKSAANIYYCKVWEQHSDGSFHLHILISILLGKRWAKNNAVAVGMGNQADWHKVENAGMVAGYVAKYTLKNAYVARGGISWPKGLRRIETSRNWPILTRRETEEQWNWYYRQNRTAQIVLAEPYIESGFTVVDKTGEKS